MKKIIDITRILMLLALLFIVLYYYFVPMIDYLGHYLIPIGKTFLILGLSTTFIGIAILESINEYFNQKK